jgi:hypothetical protein
LPLPRLFTTLEGALNREVCAPTAGVHVSCEYFLLDEEFASYAAI